MSTVSPQTRFGPAIGSMSAFLVAGLSGVSQQRLRQWRRSGMVTATAFPPQRGYPCAYRWSEYRRARVAALLLAHGLHPRRLRAVLDEYCAVVPPEQPVPTTVLAQRAAIKPSQGKGQTAERDAQGLWFDWVERVDRKPSFTANDDPAVQQAWDDFHRTGPLGVLCEFTDSIDIRPEVMSGRPTLKGRRLETAALASYRDAGDSIDAIADAYRLPIATVLLAFEFEDALEQHATAP